MIIKAFHDPGFAAPIGDHVMPMRKFQAVADAVRCFPWVEVIAPPACTDADLLRVHRRDYLEAIRTGEPKALAESQKFPWSPALFPSVRLTNGGVIQAAKAALQEGTAAAIASGFHHAFEDHGEGFCTFNGLIVAAEHLKAAHPNLSVAILDLDLHYGNGTASLVARRPWIRALSIYGNDYANNTAFRDVTVQRHQDGPNHRSASLPNGATLKTLLATLEKELPWLLETGRPDLLLFQAGADPYREDPYSPLELGIEDLLERDRAVFRWAKQSNLPVAWVLAGGYTRDLSKIIQIHVNTFIAAHELHES